MSLQLVANHLAQKGRGPDSTLVHMSNREVAGLQALAQKHGGELSVNPETGLPEAGFLDSILPAVAGFGLSAVTGIDPITAGAIVGGITALDSKDLSKGLTAGLGAWGGAGMAGGLATLGGAESLATATPAQYGAGFDAFTKAPMASLSTLGGGSALTGSLPILAGLAPAAADMMDSPDEEDTPPEQKKGYIRKYAFDPVTGQYKQMGAYEAGGDPNKDVTAEAGTAGSYGGVREPEYQQPKGMAEGGSTSDSSRIYDYLMGRGPNPMQFTHTQGPQVDYTPYMPKPITPTTQILEAPFDEYGNIKTAGGGNQSQEQREQRLADLDAKSDYLSAPGESVTMNQYWAMDSQARKDLNDAAAKRNPIRAAIGELGTPLLIRGINALGNLLPKNVDLNTNVPFKETYPSSGGYYSPVVYGPGQTMYAHGPETDNGKGFPNTPPPGLQTTPSEPPAAQVSNDNEGQPQGGGGRGNSDGPNGPEGRGDPGGDRNGWGRGGGYAHGGIANLHQYNLGSYSDGGRLLKGPGNGTSDDIPAVIGHNQPARLADGEFVIPARIVSEIGNGSTDAGARELYKMMDRIQAGRKKTVGKDQVAKNSKSVRHLPA